MSIQTPGGCLALAYNAEPLRKALVESEIPSLRTIRLLVSAVNVLHNRLLLFTNIKYKSVN